MIIIINSSEKTIEIQGIYPIGEIIDKINELLNSNTIDRTYSFKQNIEFVSYPIYPVYPYYPPYLPWPQYPIVTCGTSSFKCNG